MTEIELPQNGKPFVPPRLGFVAEELALDMVEDLKSLKGGRKRKTPGLATWGSYFLSRLRKMAFASGQSLAHLISSMSLGFQEPSKAGCVGP